MKEQDNLPLVDGMETTALELRSLAGAVRGKPRIQLCMINILNDDEDGLEHCIQFGIMPNLLSSEGIAEV